MTINLPTKSSYNDAVRKKNLFTSETFTNFTVENFVDSTNLYEDAIPPSPEKHYDYTTLYDT